MAQKWTAKGSAMMAADIIQIIALIIIGALLLFFSIPTIFEFCEEISDITYEFVIEPIKASFIIAAHKWKRLFKRWFGS